MLMPTGWHSQGHPVLANHRLRAVSRTERRLKALVCEVFQILNATFALIGFDWGISRGSEKLPGIDCGLVFAFLWYRA